MSFSAIVLAAGRGLRMHSNKAKVLHPVAGRPLLHRVLDALKEAGNVYLVVGSESSAIVQQLQSYMHLNTESLAHRAGRFVEHGFQSPTVSLPSYYVAQQHKALGTAHAVRAALQPTDGGVQVVTHEGVQDVSSAQSSVQLHDCVVVCNGDHPFIQTQDIQNLLQQHKSSGAAISLGVCRVQEPGRLGRAILKGDRVQRIVEASEATAEELKLSTVCTGLYVVQHEVLQQLVPSIQNNNSKKEYYFTDIIQLAHTNNKVVKAVEVSQAVATGVNTQLQLAQATRQAFLSKAYNLLSQGVQIIDPQHIYVEDTVQVEAGCVLYPNIYLAGCTRLGTGCVVEMGCQLHDTVADKYVQFRGGTYIQGAYIHKGSQLGPYARVRQGRVDKNCQVGNFVELKNTHLQPGVKAKHLTYLGDTEVGEDSNVGAGVVTCNYAVDRKKYKTQIGRDVFVGSGAQLVAPLHIGNEAVVGAGSVVTQNVPDGALALARSQQSIKKDYKVKSPQENKD